MLPVDTHALALLGRSHGVAARLRASVNGSDFVLPVRIHGDEASVDVDGSSPMRRKLSATVLSKIDAPEVDPLAAELRAEYAIVDPTSGRRWWTPVGTFVVQDAEEGDDGQVVIKAHDRWQRVLDARFEQPVTTSGDTLAAIEQLLLDADPRIVVDTSGAPQGYTHRAKLWERDRDKAILELAASIGCVVYFDALGVARVEPLQPLGATPVWYISPGLGGTKVRSTRGVSRSKTYNAVSVTGESDGDQDQPPVYGVARDDDPLSATRWGGPFGKRTRFYSSTLITTEAQADAVARAQLDKVRGVVRTCVVETVQHPGLDAGDVISVHVDEGRRMQLRVESFALTLGLGTMSVTAATGAADDEGGE